MSELRDQLNWTTHLLERDQMQPEPASAAHTKQLREKARALKRKLADALMEAKFKGERVPVMESGGTAVSRGYSRGPATRHYGP